jgi:hypothetical protein
MNLEAVGDAYLALEAETGLKINDKQTKYMMKASKDRLLNNLRFHLMKG